MTTIITVRTGEKIGRRLRRPVLIRRVEKLDGTTTRLLGPIGRIVLMCALEGCCLKVLECTEVDRSTFCLTWGVKVICFWGAHVHRGFDVGHTALLLQFLPLLQDGPRPRSVLVNLCQRSPHPPHPLLSANRAAGLDTGTRCPQIIGGRIEFSSGGAA
eukprot:403939-Prorocentrum_minimum.AAC.2